MKPLVSPFLAGLAALLAPLLLALVPVLPTVGGVALGPAAGVLAFVAAGLAGLALPAVRFGTHSPLVPLVAVPFLTTLVPVLEQVAAVTTGVLSFGLHALALAVAFLAGLASPAPQVASVAGDAAAAQIRGTTGARLALEAAAKAEAGK